MQIERQQVNTCSEEPYSLSRNAHHAIPIHFVSVAIRDALVVGDEGLTAGGTCRCGWRGGADV